MWTSFLVGLCFSIVLLIIKAADVVPHVVETHRGWPQSIQDDYGYRYGLYNVKAGYSETLSGYFKDSSIYWPKLAFNFARVFAVALVLNLSVALSIVACPPVTLLPRKQVIWNLSNESIPFIHHHWILIRRVLPWFLA